MQIALRIILGVVLIGSLLVAGRRVYRRLPNDSPPRNIEAAYGRAGTRLITFISSSLANATLNSPVELYPFDVAEIQRESQAYSHANKQFDDLLARRIQNVTPLKAPADSKGRAITTISAGSWWLHAIASLPNGERLEWRLPLSVAGNEQIVELTTENAYERTKKF